MVLCSRAGVPDKNPGEAIVKVHPSCSKRFNTLEVPVPRDGQPRTATAMGLLKFKVFNIIILILMCDLGNKEERKG